MIAVLLWRVTGCCCLGSCEEHDNSLPTTRERVVVSKYGLGLLRRARSPHIILLAHILCFISIIAINTHIFSHSLSLMTKQIIHTHTTG